ADSRLTIGTRSLRLAPALCAWAAALVADRLAGGGGLPRCGLPPSAVESYRRRISNAAPVRLPDPLEPEQVQEWSSRL
ncbi:hypothetical protein WFJ45_23730, partial [Salmonella enterica subsp. enterica serovar Minnesota]|uniref:hypothetical protein n=1 Tax=Salmonella enterica TaxID=28901 RepID=UPI003D2E4F8B